MHILNRMKRYIFLNSKKVCFNHVITTPLKCNFINLLITYNSRKSNFIILKMTQAQNMRQRAFTFSIFFLFNPFLTQKYVKKKMQKRCIF